VLTVAAKAVPQSNANQMQATKSAKRFPNSTTLYLSPELFTLLFTARRVPMPMTSA